jgi:hypothetical protein
VLFAPLVPLPSVAFGKYVDLCGKCQAIVAPSFSSAHADLKVGATVKGFSERNTRRLEAGASMAASSSQPGVTWGPATAYLGSLCFGLGQERGSLGATLKSKAGSIHFVLFALRPACANASARLPASWSHTAGRPSPRLREARRRATGRSPQYFPWRILKGRRPAKNAGLRCARPKGDRAITRRCL